MKEKKCPKCKTVKQLSEFAKCRTRKDGHDTWCKACRNKAERDRNAADPTRASKKGKASYQRRKHKISQKAAARRGLISWYKEIARCAVTGIADDLVFHHLDPDEKEFEISSSNTRAWSKMVEEIEKCVVVNRKIHGLIHSILKGNDVKEFPQELVEFMEEYHGWTHDGEKWHPIMKIVHGDEQSEVADVAKSSSNDDEEKKSA